MSEQHPALLYSRFAFFDRLMHGENRILRWNATRILGHLARVDSEGQIDRILDGYLAPVHGPKLIAAANAIQGAADIARAKPHLADRIAGELIAVKRARYATPECRHIAAGHAIQALDRFFELVGDRKPALAFVKSQRRNSRPATRKKAEKFWAKWTAKETRPLTFSMP